MEEARRLRRMVIKYAATDPTSGHVVIFTLTTDLSAADRERRHVTAAPWKVIREWGPAPTVAHSKLCHETREQSDIMITRETYEVAIRGLQDDGVVTISGPPHGPHLPLTSLGGQQDAGQPGPAIWLARSK